MTLTWTKDSAEGYSDYDLTIMNAAQKTLETQHCRTGDDDLNWQNAHNIHAMLHNAWHDGITLSELVSKVNQRMG